MVKERPGEGSGVFFVFKASFLMCGEKGPPCIWHYQMQNLGAVMFNTDCSPAKPNFHLRLLSLEATEKLAVV